MKKFIFFLAFFLLLSTSQDIFSSKRVVIENVTLIDAGNPIREDMTLIIDGDKIVSINKSNIGKTKLLDDDIVVQGRGKFVIPGLWDAHVHLTFIPELDYETAYDLFLMNGITSIRDTGAILEKLKPAIDFAKKNPLKTPRLFYSGPLLDGTPSVYKGTEPGYPELSVEINEDTDLTALVKNLIEQEVSFLKTYEMLSEKIFINLLKISEEKNLKVTGHIPLGIDLYKAVDNGLDGMQHIRNLELACTKDSAEGLSKRLLLLDNLESIPGSALRSKIHQAQRYSSIEDFDEDRCMKVMEHLVVNNVFQTPTLTINTVGSKRFFANEQWQETYKFLPNVVKDRWLKDSEFMAQQPLNDSYKTYQDWSMKMVDLFNKKGIKILAGTDTPIGFLTPGFSLHKELELLVESGLTPLQALRAATITPAEFFDLEDKMGTVEVGKFADLVILNNNPLIDIKHTQDIHAVILKGRISN
ncbi:amidohydrolase family protein [Gammaproteobacteria bacterium]|nr:amidohydrolase family protein [Gammaproteobacteria bacterium]